MRYLTASRLIAPTIISFLLCLNSCSKSSPDAPSNPNNPTNSCAGKTIIVTATPTASTGCTNSGSLLITASGSNGFTYKVGSGGNYQASGSFTNLAPGSYTVFARDAEGCEASSVVAITGGSTGSLFGQVKALMAVKCEPCHNNSVQNGGMNWTIDCNIVANQGRIKVRAVDEGTMPAGGPPLGAAEKAVITNWITAGGRLTD